MGRDWEATGGADATAKVLATGKRESIRTTIQELLKCAPEEDIVNISKDVLNLVPFEDIGEIWKHVDQSFSGCLRLSLNRVIGEEGAYKTWAQYLNALIFIINGVTPQRSLGIDNFPPLEDSRRPDSTQEQGNDGEGDTNPNLRATDPYVRTTTGIPMKPVPLLSLLELQANARIRMLANEEHQG